jgi:predicted ATPase/DNA-binding CsgD family transcriptional regulator/class 3 adenylate cyclase
VDDSGVPASTFLLTGVERSTPLWEIAPDAAAAAIARHHELVDSVVRDHDGTSTATGDSVLAGFSSAASAVAAALDIQRALAAEDWPSGIAIKVRIGLDTGDVPQNAGSESERRAAARCARLRDVAHGGQILLSATTADLASDALPDGARIEDLGVRRPPDLSHAERVFELRHPDLPADFPPLRSLDLLPNNLPTQLTSFVGRSGELAELERLLEAQRLVTIAGAGGCGKSRLALQAAASLASRWPDGVWWVDLGGISDQHQVVELVASTLRVLVDPSGDPLTALAGQLAGRRLLVCLDTCEHVLEACATLVDALLRAGAELSVLCTSREPLGVAGETVWRVPSLVEDDAVRLFADRAALVRPATERGADDTEITTICRRLDGIPLAIELAAAWTRALTPTQIVAGLDDRFRLLTGGPRVATPRQQTLVASMDWSHDLLGDQDRMVFRRLAVFLGSFTLDAAQSVCADGESVDGSEVLAVLGGLVDKSLVTVSTRADEARYRLLDTVRQYAEAQLRTAEEALARRDRHLDYFLALAEAAEPQLEVDQDTWRQELASHHDNIHVALHWGLRPTADGGEAERGRRLAAAMARQWFIRGQSHEGLEFLRQAVELGASKRSGLQARLLAGSALLGMVSGRLGLIEESAELGLEIAAEVGDERSRARCLAVLAYRWFLFDFERCQELAEQAAAAGDAAAEPFARDWGLVIAAYSLTTRDRHDESTALARRAYEQSHPRGDRFCAAFALGVEFWATMPTGGLRRALEIAEEEVRISEPPGDYFGYGTNATNLAIAKGMSGDIGDARRLLEPIVRGVETTPDTDVVGLAGIVGQLRLWSGDLDGAVTWFERGARFAEPDTDNWTVVRSLPGLASALRRLGRPEEALEYAERGVTLARSFEGPLWLSQALDEQAHLVAETDPGRAGDLHHEALAVRVDAGLRTFYVDSLDALARRAADRDSRAEAIRLVAASDRAREELGYPRPPVDTPAHEALVESLRTAVGPEFDALWAEGSALSLDEAVSYATRARGVRDRPASGWASLTPTEREVVRLVVDGLSNPAISTRLFVSRSTVKTHLSHVYAKLGVANRTELATYAAEQS